jgi:hypothetical protein
MHRKVVWTNTRAAHKRVRAAVRVYPRQGSVLAGYGSGASRRAGSLQQKSGYGRDFCERLLSAGDRLAAKKLGERDGGAGVPTAGAFQSD